ncbi:Aste57867_15931 [Aphanomyces stellatus]|uniref:Aste57867_15931 protein n=1 Tax=Aphanomyces stellatus TaxID=120398 RepID=A0A485L5A7_9STRA|nr:hypothetical protein As57867_015875 [Aphanomyces stellatus]VFT92717.1 Aste57867_15931 [Aphanomyces stellatus]
MRVLLRPVINAIKSSRPKSFHSNFSTNAMPEAPSGFIPPPHVHPNHHHYYYKCAPSRGQWFWTIGAGAFGYCLMSSGSSDSTGSRRMKRATHDLEETQDEVKRELSRAQVTLEQLRSTNPQSCVESAVESAKGNAV